MYSSNNTLSICFCLSDRLACNWSWLCSCVHPISICTARGVGLSKSVNLMLIRGAFKCFTIRWLMASLVRYEFNYDIEVSVCGRCSWIDENR